MKMKLMLASMLVALTLTGCGANDKEEKVVGEKLTGNITADSRFLYDSTQQLHVTLKGGEPFAAISIYPNVPADGSVEPITTIVLDENGEYNKDLKITPVTTEFTSLYFRAHYITMKSVTLNVNMEKSTIDYNYDDSTVSGVKNTKATRYLSTKLSGHLAKYDGVKEISWNSVGTPAPMTNVSVPKPLIDSLNAKFPERQIHRDKSGAVYMDKVTSDIFVKVSDAEKDVKITVIHEGAGYLNTIAYYLYPENEADLTAEYIKNNAKLVFPNFTIDNALKPGDTISIGKHPLGTKIGFAILANRWSNLNGYNNPIWNDVWNWNSKDEIFMTTSKYNKDKKQHTVMYNYDLTTNEGKTEPISIIGMEDLMYSNSDKDFNDMMIYVNQKCNGEEFNTTKTTTVYTDLVSYYPSQNSSNSLVYEDLWPSMGDYDFNDQVVTVNYKTTGVLKTETTYYYTTVRNTDEFGNVTEKTTLTDTKVVRTSEIKSMELKYELKAAGAGYVNGFGIELGIAKDKIASVTGQKILTTKIANDANGVETGSTDSSVIVVYDDAKHLLTGGANETYVNTRKKDKVYPTVTNTIVVTFKEGTSYSLLTNAAPYNPFIFRNNNGKADRGIEVHLPGQKPTVFANTSIFGLDDDGTVPADGKYYLSKVTIANGNIPWALEIPGNFKYPIETKDIALAYPQFYDWAVSGGKVNKTWFNNGNTNYLY